MSDQIKLILIAVLLVIAVIIVIILIVNTRNSNLKKDIDDINIAFNKIKTVPLAFKLNKAQAMAKRNDEEGKSVKEYYEKYEEAQKHIDQIAELIEQLEDQMAIKDYKSARESIGKIKEHISESEKEVADIDKFLEQFSVEESGQRENSTKLKEEFREIKLYVNENSGKLSIGYEGINAKIVAVEDLFSQSEEFMYTNNYKDSEECLGKINASIKQLRRNIINLPELIEDNKGIIPSLLDELSRQYALARQRGIYTDHLKISETMAGIEASVSADTKTLMAGDVDGVGDNNRRFKEILNSLLKSLNDESEKFQKLKGVGDEAVANLNSLKSLFTYVCDLYNKEKERFGLEDIQEELDGYQNNIEEYNTTYMDLSHDISSNTIAASELVLRANALLNKTNEVIKVLTAHKNNLDKNINDEQRAKVQLIKLQVVLNEVEVKVLEYRLPTIADSYKDDLENGRDKIAKIKSLLDENPLNINELNTILDEAIDFIYKFYNNVNNIVGMAIMVENAIVFGNKYRSTYPEVERDLSKAEFSYLNGEYTKALTMAIACMEKLFPNSDSTNYLENA